MEQEKYTLKWKWQGYQDHLRGMMQEMMTSENFTDVTLVTDDKKAIKAHRSVLSAFSWKAQIVIQYYISGVFNIQKWNQSCNSCI